MKVTTHFHLVSTLFLSQNLALVKEGKFILHVLTVKARELNTPSGIVS